MFSAVVVRVNGLCAEPYHALQTLVHSTYLRKLRFCEVWDYLYGGGFATWHLLSDVVCASVHMFLYTHYDFLRCLGFGRSYVWLHRICCPAHLVSLASELLLDMLGCFIQSRSHRRRWSVPYT